ncbi:cuticle protein 19-like [Chironomus tepperi]|uniref:cuticle protein 19-like n=1 Tax=Chironomus tepperi TaxID=113505 RepID=UPI00391F25E2
MNSYTILVGLALIAAAYAHEHGSSYVKRTDEHGHHAGISVEGHGDDHGHGHGHDEYKHVDYIHHPAYKYEYGVHDPKTKDHHSQWEHRDGDVVKGEYTLDEADGTKRVVKYSSDKHGGFTAHVERVGHAIHPVHYGHHEEEEHHH